MCTGDLIETGTKEVSLSWPGPGSVSVSGDSWRTAVNRDNNSRSASFSIEETSTDRRPGGSLVYTAHLGVRRERERERERE